MKAARASTRTQSAAARAPTPQPFGFNNSWKRGITLHAAERLRERLSTMNDVGRSDRELADLLDLAVHQSLCSGLEKPKVVIDEGKETTVVPLSSRFPDTWAVVRPNHHPRGPPQSIITVLTTAMVNKNIATGKWTVTNLQDQEVCRERAQAENVRIATPLAGKLCGVQLDVPGPRERAAVAVATPVPVPAAAWLICFSDGAQVHYEQVEPMGMTDRVNALLELAITPRVFKEVPLRVRVDPVSFGAAT